MPLPLDYAWHERTRRECFVPGVRAPWLMLAKAREATGYPDLDLVLLHEKWDPEARSWVPVNRWWWATVEPWCVARGTWCGSWERRLCPRDEVLDGVGEPVVGEAICSLRTQAEAIERAVIATSPNPLWRLARNEELRVRAERTRTEEEFAEIASMATWQQRKQVADLRPLGVTTAERVAMARDMEQRTLINEERAYARATALHEAAVKRSAA